MPTCGNCRAENSSIEHVKSCYAAAYAVLEVEDLSPTVKSYVERRDFDPMALSEKLAESKYALDAGTGVLRFYEVRNGVGRWEGYQFVDQLLGSPGDWRRVAIKGRDRSRIVTELQRDIKGAARRYSDHFTRCAACDSPLSDAESISRGFGPTCALKFA